MLFSYDLYGIPPSGFDPERSFVRSHFLPPVVLAIIRATIALYCFTTIIVCYSWLAHNQSTTNLQDVNISSYTIITGSNGIGQSFSFFTYLTYWSLGFYFLFASMHTFQYAYRRTTWLHAWPRPLQLLHSFYYSTVTCFPFLVSIVFWCTMYSGPWPEHRFEQWINISVHGLNSLFAIVEIVLPATAPPPWTHISILLVVLSMYLGLAYLTRFTGGFYVYEWMNPAHGWVSIVVHIACYTAGILCIFVLVQGVIRLRNKLAARGKEYEDGKEIIRLADGSKVDVSSKEVYVVDTYSVRVV
ncbi:hypothetical protein BU26DRAFT_426775 [Trematosphaeria pertusa]|uniref:FAR-17a/AIG1-like protein n=1 Tax=Trematosphaeria pertusa TaxID=390896 RepID=A0A6A6IIR3_9PLEO|nr:uncharacterized protein BU26DRAFT_426775 [Trematosphaeria pertusa]KAF2249460.1 hypothetical protein BU26DRAFT_426775 [Trematosphaeria pertusa]